MDFYREKKMFFRDIKFIIKNNAGRKVALAWFEIEYGTKYGFSKKMILKALKPFADMGHIEMNDTIVTIPAKTEENKPIERNTSSII
jgi:hypothetical protein